MGTLHDWWLHLRLRNALVLVGSGVGFTVLTSPGAEIVARQRRRFDRHEARMHGDQHRRAGA